MSKTKTLFRCTSCGTPSPQWVGRCPGCGDWNTFEEDRPVVVSRVGPARKPSAPVLLSEANVDAAGIRSSGVSEVDRVLGGGFVAGSVTLLGGEPGIGKSTLVLQLCAALAKAGARCLIVTGEESVQQVARRAERLGAQVGDVMLMAESDVETIAATVEETSPDVLIVDSVQTMNVSSIGSSAGTVAQVRESAQAFVSMAKQRNMVTLLIGHVTKDGSLAGPRVLEHMVDTVLEFEGDRHHGLRFLRTSKHRYGATDEVGVLEMTEQGLQSVPDASGMFLDDRHPGITGSVVTPLLQGRRPMLIELQALVSDTTLSQPRRVAQGIDSNRLAVVIAVLKQSASMVVGMQDAYVSVVGGLKVVDPGIDLPLALALASSMHKVPIAEDVVAVGELGLGGEVRKVSNMTKRLNEAARMGFRRAIVPEGSPAGPTNLTLIPVKTLRHAVRSAGVSGAPA